MFNFHVCGVCRASRLLVMFYYLSFLRPPPRSVSSSAGTISFTPQIANDLRTELLQEEIEIYYAWAKGASLPGTSSVLTTQLRKLTTWKGPQTAYKPVSVPLPPNCRAGESWKILLASGCSGTLPSSERGVVPIPGVPSAGSPSVVPSLSFGSRPFPVWSTDIIIDKANPIRERVQGKPKSGGKSDWSAEGPKQERIERHFSLFPFSAAQEAYTGLCLDSPLVLTEQTSFDLDKKVWDSGLGLSSYLTSLLHPQSSTALFAAIVESQPLVGEIRDLLISTNGCRIVELGAGIGVVSIFLAAALEAWPSSPDSERQILVTDLASALPLIEHNVGRNKSLFASTRLQVASLDWDQPLHSCQPLADFPDIDIIIMADVTYNTSSFPSLLRTLKSLLMRSAAVHSRDLTQPAKIAPRILLGYKERDPGERDLWVAARESGIEFLLVARVPGVGESPVEIWLGSLVK